MYLSAAELLSHSRPQSSKLTPHQTDQRKEQCITVAHHPLAGAMKRRNVLFSTCLIPQLSCSWAQAANAPPRLLTDQQQQFLQEVKPHKFVLADVQADYDRYSSSYDKLDGGAVSSALGFPDLRKQLLQQAHGDVLEVGIGTGLNLPMYDWSNVTRLTGVDLSAGMLQEAAARAGTNTLGSTRLQVTLSSADGGSSSSSSDSSSAGVPLQLIQADVTSLPLPDSCLDTVVDTFSLCVFPLPLKALSEMLRVLKPGGTLLLLEHTLSDQPVLGAYQSATRSLVAPISKGCDWGQDVPNMVAALPGCRVVQQQRHLAGTLVSIRAVKA